MRDLQQAKESLAADAGQAPELESAAGGERATASKAQQRAHKADDYHARHQDWVAQFNELTHGECAGGPGGLKWVAVRAWQQKHWQINNLFADGLVGPKTLEAARLVAKQHKGGKADAQAEPEAQDAPEEQHEQASGGGDEQQPESPTGNADAAEASADKPKLEEPGAEPTPEAAAPAEGVNATHGPTQSDAKLDDKGAAGGLSPNKEVGKKATLLEFEQKLQQIDELLKDFKPPAGQGALPQSALAAANGSNEKDPTKQAEPAGQMMNHLPAYRSAIAGLKDWNKWSAEKRAAELKHKVNEALAFERVFPIKEAELGPLAPGNDGSFNPSKWEMTVNEKELSKPMNPAEINDFGSSVFHEGRHAEQRFSVARFMASQNPNMKEDEIAQKAQIDPDAVRRAVQVEKQHPLAPQSPERKQAELFYDDTVRHGDEHNAIEQLAAKVNRVGPEARAVFDSLPPQEQAVVRARWEDYRARMYQVVDAYQRLATERDAFAAEGRLGIKKQ